MKLGLYAIPHAFRIFRLHMNSSFVNHANVRGRTTCCNIANNGHGKYSPVRKSISFGANYKHDHTHKSIDELHRCSGLNAQVCELSWPVATTAVVGWPGGFDV